MMTEEELRKLKTEIPSWLRDIKPELQERIDREQRERRIANEAQLRPRTREERFLRDWQREADSATANLKTLEQSDAPKEDVDQQRTRLTAALVHLGRFEEALLAAPDDDQRRYVRRVIKAVDKDDSHICKCGDVPRVTAGNKEAILPGSNTTEHIFSPVHSKITPLVVCAKCGSMNVTPEAPKHDPVFHKTQAEIDAFTRYVNRPR